MDRTEIGTEKNFFDDARQIVIHGREEAGQAINSVMIQTYWLLGERIVKQDQSSGHKKVYGKYILETLSSSWTREYGRGFSDGNLWYFRQFYILFPLADFLNTRVQNLSCSHYRIK